MIKNIVIVGGGTAGWMTAAALSRHLPKQCNVRLIESDQIATVGVGEATIPVIRAFNAGLGIDEQEFMRETNASFKLSIRFQNWGEIGEDYYHAFGYYGFPIKDVSFHHYWMKMQQNEDVGGIHEYNMPYMACADDKFEHKQYDHDVIGSRYFYAFQFDAGLYARYLRKWSEAKGVTRIEGKVTEVSQNNETGFVESVTLESGECVEGDLFVDCSGFRALLLEKTLKIGYKDWSHWLPVNRAWAVSTAYESEDTPIPPYTRARALTAGWQWRIPLQNRTGDGNVFCEQYISEDKALDQLLENIEGKPINEPRLLKFTTGKREKLWHKNCVAIGLSGGFLEPLESTSIALIQGAILLLIRNFPNKDFAPATENEFNRRMDIKYEESRNFLIMHYHVTKRNDSEFWNYCRTMKIPEELQHRIDIFRHSGRIAHQDSDLFIEHNWLQVLYGQGLKPESYDPRVDAVEPQEVKRLLAKMKTDVARAAKAMPTHNETLAQYCAGDLISNRLSKQSRQ